MHDREKVIREFEYEVKKTHDEEWDFVYLNPNFADKLLALLKEQDELLHKKHKDIDRLCAEISEWKHKYHDRPLKEQEAIEPVKIPWLHSDGSVSEKYRCGSCDLSIFPSYKFCPFCGQAVKWNE